jgi:hypothetical protein
VGVVFGTAGGVRAQATTGVLREVFTGIGGGAVSDLTNNAAFPCCPTIESIQPTFEAPSDFADNYGTRMRALVRAPLSGQYTFWIASDDNSTLFLSTSADPAKKAPIAWVTGATGSREWTREANQKSGPVTLAAGTDYYIEALQKEGGGGDNLAVRWQLPNATIEEPIPGTRLAPYGLGPPVISRQPTNTSVVESSGVVFTIALQRQLGARFQWFRGTSVMPGATNATLILPLVTLADSGSTFFCSVTNDFGGLVSQTATLSVRPDTTPPTLSTAGAVGDGTSAFVVFSEPVEPASATNIFNYTFTAGVVVMRVEFGDDPRTVLLHTTPMPPSTLVTLTVSNVRDRATTPNPIKTVTRDISTGQRPLDIGFLSLPREPMGPSTRRHGVVISEVMYHPTNRIDGRNLEYVELYNSQPWFEEIGGWRLSGAIDYTFPSNTVLASRGFLVVAAVPADFKSVYTFTNVYGPFAAAGSLQNSSGVLRLRNAAGAIVFEMTYSGDPPYPVAADGGGHSLVLGRPSYGERDPRAWMASERIGGTPGAAETAPPIAERFVVINEVLAHTDAPTLDFVELYNYGSLAVNLGGCVLTDDPATNTFVIPAGTVIPARGFLSFDETQLGFSLSSSGESVFLKNAAGTRIIDALRFPAQENGVALGRFPDGAPAFQRLAQPTPGSNNAPARAVSVVFNEVMFDPITGDPGDQYVELFNRGASRVDLSGWRLRGGITYKFPVGIGIDPGAYLVVAADMARMRSNYTTLTFANLAGNFSGKLASDGDHLELQKPDLAIGTNSVGQLRTNTIHVVEDEVTYGAAGRWGPWSHGGGSSLELRDPGADRMLAPNWADSDETFKSGWVTVQAAGVMDNGWADCTQLHVTLLGAGEALVDNIEVVPSGSTNVVLNGAFDAGTSGWVFQGNHNQSGWEPSEGYTAPGCLHLRATGRGDSGANRVRVQLARKLNPGQTVTLRARARWLRGNPNLLLRLRGNWLEAPAMILAARNLGSPGVQNSRAVANAGPAITAVRHWPAAPSGGQPVLVTAQVSDPNGLGLLAVAYRVDPSTNLAVLAMTNNGAGLYSGAIPSQAAGATVAFHVRALDASTPAAASTFPADAPVHECVVRWGDSSLPGTLGTYRLWLTQTNVNRWIAEEKMSNNGKDVTFLYGTNRVVYNAAAWFHGSPYHSPGYDSPLGSSCDYDMGFPADDPLLGETDINLYRPGNGGGDGTAQAEIHGYWFAAQSGIPFLYCRPVFVFINGQRRETVFLDAQQPNGGFVRQWYPSDSNGDLHKVQLGFEFGDLAYGASEPGYAVVGASLSKVQTTAGAYKTAWYRATLPRRSAAYQELNDYTNIYRLVETAMTNATVGSDRYTVAQTNMVDVAEWYQVDVIQHLFNNPDSFSYGGGQNAFLYKPERDTWKLFLWDIDFAFGGDPNDANLTGIGGQEHGPVNSHPAFQRIYWQTLQAAANGILTAARSEPILTARYNGMVAGGAAVGDPSGIKSFIATRRNLILSQLAAYQSPFTIKSNKGLDFSTNRNLIVLSGTAPLEARTLLINGVPYPVSWTSVSNWSARVPLHAGLNTLSFTGLDAKGNPVASAAGTIRVTFTGVEELPQDRIALNEIHYHPAVAGSGFVELFNRSTTNAFDISGWRLSGAGFTFPSGAVLEPNSYAVVVEDLTSFTTAFGPMSSVVGEYGGRLQTGGETLSLIRPGGTPAEDVIIDQVTYDNLPPWPASADGLGYSLQLLDPAQDNNRSASWVVATGALKKATPGGLNSVKTTLAAYPRLWLNEICPTNPVVVKGGGKVDGFGQHDPWVELYNGGTNTLSLAGYFLSSQFTNLTEWGFPLTTQIGPGQFLLVWLDGEMGQSSATELHASFRAAPLSGSVVLSRGAATSNIVDYIRYRIPVAGRSYGSYPDGAVSGRRAFAVMTPGGTNDPTAPPINVRINEWMADNGTTLADPSDGDYEDWFELWNGADEPADLTGCTLTDDPANPGQFKIPAGTSVPPHGFLLVWADGEPGQNAPDTPDLHANFSLAKGGETIALYASDGTLVDSVTFGAQTRDVSQGRFPDGGDELRLFTNATPRLPNYLALPNTPPTLDQPADRDVDEGVLLTVRLRGGDTDIPAQTLKYTLEPGAPEGAELGASDGVFRWIPSESQGPGVYLIGVAVTDNGVPPLSASRTFQITVHEANSPPVLDPLLSRSVVEGHLLTVTATALDPDGGGQALRFSLDSGAPSGMQIDPVLGALSWTPDESQGPGNYSVTVRVTDNGVPPLSDAKTFTVSVSEENQPPSITPIPDQHIASGGSLDLEVVAVDPDLPRQGLVFVLQDPVPDGAAIDPASGRITWTPGPSDQDAVRGFHVLVHDDGTPALYASAQFNVTVGTPLRIIDISRFGPAVRITWASVPGRSYRLEYNDSFNAEGWTDANLSHAAQETPSSVLLPLAPVGLRMYRVVQLP